MKIGILTFHWAANYGAVLQCLALQSYLEQLGHTVEVINYKPKQYDNNLCNFFRFRKFLDLRTYLNDIKKENAIKHFRNRYLRLSNRYYNLQQVAHNVGKYDAIISGSDQILNPYFLLKGEGGRTPTYFLEFPFSGKKIAYAVSFGCTVYPAEAAAYAKQLVGNFDFISVRENTGKDIVCKLGRDDVSVVPDPTALMNREFYSKFISQNRDNKEEYIYLFFIRNVRERLSALRRIIGTDIRANNDDGEFLMDNWLQNIGCAKGVVTDSFHAMMMSLKMEVPFVVITEQSGNVGMNDRFYSLLARLGLTERIVDKGNMSVVPTLLEKDIDWAYVRTQMNAYKQIGEDYLSCSLNSR